MTWGRIVAEIGRVWDPDRRKYIIILNHGVPSLFYGYYDPVRHRIHLPKNWKSADKYMDICIHESLHAVFPHMSEEIITKKTPIMKRLLLKMGVQPVSGD